MSQALPKVCVIGAGSSGLPVVKALKERSIPVTCFEKTPNIGGLWCIDNKALGASAAYDSLHINTDTRMMEYREYPMPREMLEMQEANDRRFVRSTRHTMEVDFVPFLHSLRKLRKRGRRLAARRGREHPIAARAA
jgi:cation diffusion facilitator CzcD-associated flavoprotein CzcO